MITACKNFIRENKIISLLLGFDVVGILLTFIFNSVLLADELEHLHNSYLISAGFMPYRDFFEHHNPLLWLIFSPLFKILPPNVMLYFYIARSTSIICSAISLHICYLIMKRFLKSAEIFGYFLAFLFIFYPAWYCFSLFKPDVLARMFYVLGIYCYFCYLENLQTKNLLLCALNFVISFLFLQTVIFSIAPLIIPTIYLFYKNKKFWYDALISSMLPAGVLFIGVWLLTKYDIWDLYIQLNVVFNSKLFSLLYSDTPSMLWYWSPYIIAAVLGWILILKSSTSIYWRICGLLFICELLQHIYFPAVMPHYLILLFVFSALPLASLYHKYKTSSVKTFVCALLFVNLLLNLFTLYQHNNRDKIKFLQQINQTENNQVLNIEYGYINIFAKPLHYYSTGFNNLVIIDDYLFHRFPQYDVNDIVFKHKPRYINAKKSENITFPESHRFILKDTLLEDYTEIAPELYERK